jgi:hypothetical protein
VCRAADCQGSTRGCFASFTHTTHGRPSLKLLKKHCRSKTHRHALKLIAGTANNNVHTKPSHDELRRVWCRVRTAAGQEGNTAKKRYRRCRWCLAEAVRWVNRLFLKTARTMSINSDGRNGKLLLRFKACNDELHVRAGILGLEQDYGTGSQRPPATTDRRRPPTANPTAGPPLPPSADN